MDSINRDGLGKRLYGLCYILPPVYTNVEPGRWQNIDKRGELVVSRPPLNLPHLFMIGLSVICRIDFEVTGQVVINCLAVMCSGMTMAYPAVTLPALAAAGFDIKPAQVSLVVTAYYVMILLGSYGIGPVMDKWGRKKSLLLSMTPSITGWILAGSQKSMTGLVAGMIFLGAGMGLTNSCASVYISEIVSKEWRSSVYVVKDLSFSAGVTVMYFLGCMIRDDWRKISLISTSVPVFAFLLGIFYLKESRLWFQRSTKEGMNMYLFGLHKKSFWHALCTRPDVYRPYYTANGILILFHLSGSTVLITYVISLLKSAGVETDPYAIAVTLGLSYMTGILLAVIFAESWGYRSTLVYSGTLMSFSLLYLARLHKISGIQMTDWPTYTAEAFLACFTCTSSMFLTAAESLKEKIYPPDVRLGCRALGTLNSWMASSIVVVTYPVCSVCWGLDNLFMVYATANVACAVLAIFTLPEIEKPAEPPLERGAHALPQLRPALPETFHQIITGTEDEVLK